MPQQGGTLSLGQLNLAVYCHDDAHVLCCRFMLGTARGTYNRDAEQNMNSCASNLCLFLNKFKPWRFLCTLIAAQSRAFPESDQAGLPTGLRACAQRNPNSDAPQSASIRTQRPLGKHRIWHAVAIASLCSWCSREKSSRLEDSITHPGLFPASCCANT